MKKLVIIILFFPLLSYSQTVVNIEKIGGVYQIPCKVNGLNLKFIFDTGASEVSISKYEAGFMLRNGYISRDDILGTQQYQLANGEIITGTKIRLKMIEIGGKIISNVIAGVVDNASAPLLLGQSAIEKLGSYQFNYENQTITFNSGNSNPILSGCVSGNCYNGYGIQRLSDGSKYEGQFINRNFQGNGTYTFPNGDKYEGQFINNNFEGNGTLYYSDNSYEFGKWKDDRMIYGEVYMMNSYFYKGEINEGKFNGKGIFIAFQSVEPAKNKEEEEWEYIFDGYWKDDVFISGKMITGIMGVNLVEYDLNTMEYIPGAFRNSELRTKINHNFDKPHEVTLLNPFYHNSHIRTGTFTYIEGKSKTRANSYKLYNGIDSLINFKHKKRTVVQEVEIIRNGEFKETKRWYKNCEDDTPDNDTNNASRMRCFQGNLAIKAINQKENNMSEMYTWYRNGNKKIADRPVDNGNQRISEYWYENGKLKLKIIYGSYNPEKKLRPLISKECWNHDGTKKECGSDDEIYGSGF